MSRKKSHMLVTGGAGFIGSNFIRFLFEKTSFEGIVVNYDKLTYAGNLENVSDIQKKYDQHRYFFERGDICDEKKVKKVFQKYEIDTVVHFAAESHVDRSIEGPAVFLETNVHGTYVLLEAAKRFWKGKKNVRFHHVSTDEVYGTLGTTGYFYETTAYHPRSPYSASKAASDHFVRAYFYTYGLPITISNCSNNFGPYQYREKLIPTIVFHALLGKPIPIYGDGKNIRDWLYVEDHCRALWMILNRGKEGETYNIGGNCEKTNLELVHLICNLLEEMYPSEKNPKLFQKTYQDLITFVKDRPGHDQRYAICCDKIKKELNWELDQNKFLLKLKETLKFYGDGFGMPC